jgi:hypothetical protein
MNGAEGGTRTPTGFPTTPSRWRVCQFHHFGIKSGPLQVGQGTAKPHRAEALNLFDVTSQACLIDPAQEQVSAQAPGLPDSSSAILQSAD